MELKRSFYYRGVGEISELEKSDTKRMWRDLAFSGKCLTPSSGSSNLSHSRPGRMQDVWEVVDAAYQAIEDLFREELTAVKDVWFQWNGYIRSMKSIRFVIRCWNQCETVEQSNWCDAILFVILTDNTTRANALSDSGKVRAAVSSVPWNGRRRIRSMYSDEIGRDDFSAPEDGRMTKEALNTSGYTTPSRFHRCIKVEYKNQILELSIVMESEPLHS